MSNELLPCPFCGTRPTLGKWHGGVSPKNTIHCENYNCAVLPGVTGVTPYHAIKKWNTRAPQTDHETSSCSAQEANATLLDRVTALEEKFAKPQPTPQDIKMFEVRTRQNCLDGFKFSHIRAVSSLGQAVELERERQELRNYEAQIFHDCTCVAFLPKIRK